MESLDTGWFSMHSHFQGLARHSLSPLKQA